MGESHSLKTLSQYKKIIASDLLRIELFRNLDKLRIKHGFNEAEFSERMRIFHLALKTIELIEISKEILDLSISPFPTTVSTLDAIHLATAILWKKLNKHDLTILTHDKQLALAAHTIGFEVQGHP